MIMTIIISLGEALLVDKITSQIKSPDANAQGDFLYTHVIARTHLFLSEAISYFHEIASSG